MTYIDWSKKDLNVNNQFLIVIPIFNGSKYLNELLRILTSGELTKRILLVDDWSSDDSWKIITELSHAHKNIQGIRLKSNCGQHIATLAGLYFSEEEMTATIDQDQIPLLLPIASLFDSLDQHYSITYLVPKAIMRSKWRLAGSRLGLGTINLLSSFSLKGIYSIRLINKGVLKLDRSFSTNSIMDLELQRQIPKEKTAYYQTDLVLEANYSKYSFGNLIRLYMRILLAYTCVTETIMSLLIIACLFIFWQVAAIPAIILVFIVYSRGNIDMIFLNQIIEKSTQDEATNKI